MKNTAHRFCPKCGTAIAPGSLQGLCPNCLALVAFGSDPGSEQTVITPAHGLPSDTTAMVQPAAKPLITSNLPYFGDYELLEEVARGGMGVVYKARQKSLNRIVAVKMILGGQFTTEADVKRFRTEAEAAANLKHPNIVAIHETGEHEGKHYFSMDYVEGKNLAQVIGGEPLPAQKAATLLKTIAEAVHYAHQRGTLHRDLKPHNVMVDTDGQPHITDFGLAKLLEQQSDLTHTGTVMGSPSYMPPEQASGRLGEIGPASDVYSLGAILYQMLTGKAPFLGATAVNTLRAVIEQEPVPPSKLNAKAPNDLETICLKCLEKKPERRYASARDLAEELDRFLNYEPILAKPAGGLRRVWNWTQKNPWALVGAFALLLLGVMGVAYGFWERLRYNDWRLQTKLVSEREFENSPALAFLVAFPLLMLLIHAGRRAFRRFYQQQTQIGREPASARLLAHAGFGLIGILAGMSLIFLQIHCWAWQMSAPWLLWLEIPGVACALVLNWLGFQMLWEAVGIHEASRFRELVDKSVETELKYEARRWPAWKLVLAPGWLICVVWVFGMTLRLILEEGRDKFIAGAIILVASLAAGLWIAWAVRRRARLFTCVFAPAAISFFVLLLIIFNRARPYLINPVMDTIYIGLGVLLPVTGRLFWKRRTPAVSERKRFPGNPWLDALGGVAVFVGLMIGFHLVENWRGHREWARVKAELEAKGEILDYESFRQPRVPDEQNVIQHPFMKKYFIQGAERFEIMPPPYDDRALNPYPYQLNDLKKLPRRPDSETTILKLAGGRASQEVIPLLVFTNQPLAEVFSELARRAGVNFSVAAKNDLPWVYVQQGRGKQTPRITLVARDFHNVTALQAMDWLARSYSLGPDLVKWRETGVLTLVWQDAKPSWQGILD